MFDQSAYTCRIEWGRRGAREASERGDITIIVDVLSFSSTVTTAVEKGAIIYPYPPSINEEEKRFAEAVGAELILGRAEAARIGKPTLSPVSFNKTHANKKYVLCSLNGAYCASIAASVPALLIGCLLNASSVAAAANHLGQKMNKAITVVPCGEQWNDIRKEEDRLRPAIEDYLGAGAILSFLNGSKSPEAEVCVGAFKQSQKRITELLWESGSSRELRERGFEEDVKHCIRLNVCQTVPVLESDHFAALRIKESMDAKDASHFI
ncbi:2-phosphosulfolactate phosphatase [Pseudalkalibacillus caeni]|uniref:Probable 2-phosphosulfolactate phosphatase n=1 Tax=Exobacillus caeni TaxID=2574798 RepID=A0A5R9F6F2_9BACL|nr:2-phosphosulfolactate phosphatase [Pseudalkalibacillus caeni]TLS36054.1 2-phosphosulfolactate phosphatase [Pseudalkalibacillus caeni]